MINEKYTAAGRHILEGVVFTLILLKVTGVIDWLYL